MKVLIVNQSDRTGGAAVATMRLVQALNTHGNVQVRMLVHEQKTNDAFVATPHHSFWYKYHAFFNFAAERFHFLMHEKDKSVRFAFSSAITGHSITAHPFFEWADIIHLHWINFGFISLSELDRIFASEKKIVWTMHDMWAFTGGCHYAASCIGYRNACGNCPYLSRPQNNDLSARLHRKKHKVIANRGVVFVTPSQWMRNMALTSSILKNETVVHIQNPVDTDFFYPLTKTEARKSISISSPKKLILFGAMSVKDKRKGFEYLHKALMQLAMSNPQSVNEYALLVFGKSSPEMFEGIPFEVINLTYLNSAVDIRNAYNSADVFVIPSLEDNLPNTILEAHACGIPVVGFRLTGIEEMIQHRYNGYLAEPRDATDLADGINWVLTNPDYNDLVRESRNAALLQYKPQVVADKMINLYSQFPAKSV